ncbi:MAG: NERD domain-containing protein [Clostridiaceae bacterium]|nr:NERD domain-containing protein [Clostridiaceae bacterium]
MSVILILMNMFVFGIIILFFSVIIGYGLYSDGKTNGKSWNKGIMGEKTVASFLNQLPEDYFIFNDVKFPGSYGNLDHIVIGPSGIFVIEPKNFEGQFIVDGDVWYYKNGEYLKESKSQPGTQAKRNAISLKKFLEKNNIKMYGVWIDPIVTLVNENFEINKNPKYYEVLPPRAIPKYILNKRNDVDINILQSAIDLLEPYCNELSYLEADC